MPPPNPQVDVVIPVLNGGARLAACLSAIAAQEGVRARVVVADNGSTDGSVELARAAGAILVDAPKRSSYIARNAGVLETAAQVIAFTDADCRPDPRWLAAAVRCMDEEGFDLCAGRVEFEEPTTAAGRHDALTYLDQEQFVSRGFAATANLVLRRTVFERIGPFREDLASGGDMDFCRRAVAAGFQLGYCAEAVVSHPPRDTLRGVLRKAWRIGLGHGALALDDEAARRKWFHVRSLKPARKVRQAADPQVLAVEIGVRLTTYTARRVGYRRAILRRPH